jgi:hypothetical protein
VTWGAVAGDVPGVPAGGGRCLGETMEVLTLAIACPGGRPAAPVGNRAYSVPPAEKG